MFDTGDGKGLKFRIVFETQAITLRRYLRHPRTQIHRKCSKARLELLHADLFSAIINAHLHNPNMMTRFFHSQQRWVRVVVRGRMHAH